MLRLIRILRRRKKKICIHYCCRSCSEHAPLCRKKPAGGCRVFLGAGGVHVPGCLTVLPVGLGLDFLNRVDRGGPRLGYFWAAVFWAACRVDCSEGGCWSCRGCLPCGHCGLWWWGSGHRLQQNVSVCGSESPQSPDLYLSAMEQHKELFHSHTSPGWCEWPSWRQKQQLNQWLCRYELQLLWKILFSESNRLLICNWWIRIFFN